jgi:diketogulonate reductase-like aldo/keto reductase
MKQVRLADGAQWPAIGLGTWRLGEQAKSRGSEVAAVRRAIELGYRLIDTAEMYGDGGAEEVVGQAIADALRAGDCRRDELIVVSKVLPSHASLPGVLAACERSLARLQLETIDLYLLHWPGPHPLPSTIAAFQQLVSRGSIARWGVSNFDRAAMVDLVKLRGGAACATNQVYYSLGERGVEFDLRPWHRKQAMPMMAYSPVDQGALTSDERLASLAQALGLTAVQLALAWAVRDGDVIAIPKAVQEVHLRDNLAAGHVELDGATLSALDALHPPPRRARPLAMI